MYTQHAVQRAMERTGRDEESAKQFISNAIDYGTLVQDLPPNQQAYIRDKTKSENTAVIYNHYIFIVGDDGSCITMFEAPEWFDNMRKPRRPRRSNEPVRHVKKWQKMKGIRKRF